MGRYRGTVTVFNYQYHVSDVGIAPPGVPAEGNSNGLIAVTNGFAVIVTGTAAGPVRLTVEFLDSEPSVDMADWTEIIDTSYHTITGLIAVVEIFTGFATDFPQAKLPAGSWCRLRAHAKGRDAAFAYDVPLDEPMEEHLLQLWPAPESAEVCHLATDQVGAGIRSHLG